MKIAKSDRFPRGDARLAWVTLEQKFEPGDGQTLIALKKEFTQLVLEDNEDPDVWITDLLLLQEKCEISVIPFRRKTCAYTF